MPWTIYGAYEHKPSVEVIDHADDEDTARYLVGEYQLAFGSDWDVWCTECDDDEYQDD